MNQRNPGLAWVLEGTLPTDMAHPIQSLPDQPRSTQSVADNFSDEWIQIWILFAKDIFYK